MKNDESWVSGSEEGDDIPDGTLPHRGRGAINLREAMAQAKLPVIEKGKGQTSPHVEPLVGVVTRDHHGEEVDDITLSDWDEEEEETQLHPSPVHNSTHNSTPIPAVIGASREPSGLQHDGCEEGGRGGEEGGVSGDSGEDGTPAERANVSPGVELGLKDESILSSDFESESDLPLFGGYAPSTAQTGIRSPLPHLPPIRQGSTPIKETPPLQKVPMSTPTSPTVVTPLSISTGMATHNHLHTLHNDVYLCSWTISISP